MEKGSFIMNISEVRLVKELLWLISLILALMFVPDAVVYYATHVSCVSFPSVHETMFHETIEKYNTMH